MCFIPTADGTSHASLGMVEGFSVAEWDNDDVPDPHVTITAIADRLDDPAEIDARETSIEVVNESPVNREITLFKGGRRKHARCVAAFFEAADESARFRHGTTGLPRLRVRRSLGAHDHR